MDPGTLASSKFAEKLVGLPVVAEGHTHFGEGPPSSLDHFVFSGGLGKTVKSCEVIQDTTLSPHRPVQVVLHASF
eukprot:9479054-Pyramimonas_sp.AAC.1